MSRIRPCRPLSRPLPGRTLLWPLVWASILLAPAAGAFELQRMDDVRVNLDDFVGGGRWTLVQLWTTDCIPCERQKPMLEAFHREHAQSRAQVVGIALDGPDAMAEIESVVARHDPSYPTLVAFDDVFGEQFQALTGKSFRATPTYLLYAPDGAYAGVHTGPIDREQLERIVVGEAR